jgi:hypothetical protein
MGMAGAVQFSQEAFRVRNDIDGPNDEGWRYPLDTNWVQAVDTPFRIRFSTWKWVRFNDNITDHGLYYSVNGGAFTFLDDENEVFTTDSVLWAIESNVPSYVDGDDVDPPQLGNSWWTNAESFGADLTYNSDNDGVSESPEVTTTWNGSGGGTEDEYAEHEWVLTVRSSLVSIGDQITIRMYGNDSAYTRGYAVDAVLTVGHAINRLQLKGGTTKIKGGTIKLK